MELDLYSDEYYMKQALLQAQQAYDEKEIPVGAVIVAKNRIIARAYNQVEKLHDVTAHAEMIALTSAQNYLGAKYLDQCTLYVTLEPCTMCAGALYWSQIGRIVIAARDPSRGFSRLSPPVIHPKTEVSYGLLEFQAEALIKDFFKKMRTK
ncbi:MAG: nucleoside deaminase [Cyclobacteriaceae bacterium]|nr:nucleoside deaminase [Cyclobacteriaceae bacterium]